MNEKDKLFRVLRYIAILWLVVVPLLLVSFGIYSACSSN